MIIEWIELEIRLARVTVKLYLDSIKFVIKNVYNISTRLENIKKSIFLYFESTNLDFFVNIF